MSSRGVKLRLFIIESPDPMDLLQDRSEMASLEKVCKMIGHESAGFTVKSEGEFSTVCNYISTIDVYQDTFGREKVPLCVHLSAHGNRDGIFLGGKPVNWKALFNLFSPLFTKFEYYDGDVILVISACKANFQVLTDMCEAGYKEDPSLFKPPVYLFVTAGSPRWEDALVSWTVFYHQLPKVSLTDKKGMQRVLNRSQISSARLKYFRWDEDKKCYRDYTSRELGSLDFTVRKKISA